MNSMKKLLYSLMLWFFLFFSAASARAFLLDVTPAEITQGDPFVVRVEGATAPPKAVLSEKTFVFSPCGAKCFITIAAVDVDAAPGEHIIEVTAGEESQAFVLTVREGTFPEQQLTLPEGKVALSPEDEERANREAARLRALWPRPSERLWDGAFIMPLENSFSTRFGTKRIINGKKKSIHSGLDIRGKKGEQVKAANDGRVALAEELFFGGKTIVLDHGQGIFTIYMHLSKIDVSAGSVVLKGDVVGLVGSTGRSTGPHLHYGVKVNAVNANPRSLAALPLPGEEGAAHGPY
jgi:murein DD-endopeptidase MepM/ murein hydrolase activator NlpD